MKLALYEENRKVFTTDLESLVDLDVEEVDIIKYNDKFYTYVDTAWGPDPDNKDSEVIFGLAKIHNLV